MYPHIQLALSLIALLAVAGSAVAIMMPQQRSAKPLLAKWPYAVILFESAYLTPFSSPQVDILVALTLSLSYWLGAASLRTRLPEISRLWKFLGAVLPFLILLMLNKEAAVISFYSQNIWLATAMTLLFLGLLLRRYFLQRSLTALLYPVGLVFMSILFRFELPESYMAVLVLLTLLIELIHTFKLLREVKQDLAQVTAKHESFEKQFEKEVELEVKKRTFYMELSKERMAEVNRTDHLTKLLNRKTLIASVNEAINNRNTSLFTLFVFDIDYFKQINDRYGHTTGDVCLKNLAAVLKSQLDGSAFAGRFGGDEFIVVLPNKGFKEGLSFGRQLMAEIAKQENPSFSISMGMAVYPWDGETYKALFDTADKGLYFAKEKGRKRLGYKGYIKPSPQDLKDYDI